MHLKICWVIESLSIYPAQPVKKNKSDLSKVRELLKLIPTCLFYFVVLQDFTFDNTERYKTNNRSAAAATKYQNF